MGGFEEASMFSRPRAKLGVPDAVECRGSNEVLNRRRWSVDCSIETPIGTLACSMTNGQVLVGPWHHDCLGAAVPLRSTKVPWYRGKLKLGGSGLQLLSQRSLISHRLHHLF
ncbi:hypothetical protein MAA_11184 [Metarhizium robertsii ARSEF 23]|uniref:Uncharacterized protein n=1 Tax=Metarhizium robertsii (strain ARSEF 23 / ATCC MYA-3075) TaxID=655844 RepID=A0A0B2XGR5_METRA|nr:uncharacterized protein MAA_11184 [Metarhizium robertsii ARSEF 23]KHO11106.1 hypothetical protein MAA_11184 [Metarhizium robertsii ARSEF 23]